jgi:hypothetical protein
MGLRRPTGNLTDSSMADRRASRPWTVRVAAWSARHRWPVVALWFLLTIGLFVGSLAMGGTLTADAVDEEASEDPTYEAARAYDLFGASGTRDTTHRTLFVVGDPVPHAG